MLRTTSATLAIILAGGGVGAAQDGAYDADPYFETKMDDPYAAPAAETAPPRASQGATERAAPSRPRALPRPRDAARTPSPRTAAYAAAPQAQPGPYRASAANAVPERAAALRPLSAYVEARTGWDGQRGDVRGDGVLIGATAGFDRVIARLAGGRLHAGLLASIDLSTAQRANASVTRDETGPDPVLTLTERPTSETRDVEVGARLGWRTDRFGFYAMAALSNSKREVETVVTPFTESVDPDDPDAVVFSQGEVQRSGPASLFADGWRVGAGVEARIYGPAYVHLGYRYTDYDGAGGERHQVLTGVGARF